MSKLDHSSKSHTHSYVSFHSLFIVFLRPHHCRCCLFFTCVSYFLIVRPRNVFAHTPFVYMIVNNLADCVKQIFMGLLEQPNNKRNTDELEETTGGQWKAQRSARTKNGKRVQQKEINKAMIVREKKSPESEPEPEPSLTPPTTTASASTEAVTAGNSNTQATQIINDEMLSLNGISVNHN